MTTTPREIEPDHGADHPYYEAHDIIVRKGKIWIITQVALQYVLSGPKSPLTLVLSLSEHRPVASSNDQTSEVYETIFPQFIPVFIATSKGTRKVTIDSINSLR